MFDMTWHDITQDKTHSSDLSLVVELLYARPVVAGSAVVLVRGQTQLTYLPL